MVKDRKPFPLDRGSGDKNTSRCRYKTVLKGAVSFVCYCVGIDLHGLIREPRVEPEC